MSRERRVHGELKMKYRIAFKNSQQIICVEILLPFAPNKLINVSMQVKQPSQHVMAQYKVNVPCQVRITVNTHSFAYIDDLSTLFKFVKRYSFQIQDNNKCLVMK